MVVVAFSRASIIAALILGGCSIHPLPDDVTHIPTNLIVRHVRCEARDGIKQNLLDYLSISPSAADRKIAQGISDGTIPFETVNDAMFQGDSQTIVKTFENAAIAYDFKFDITEADDIDPSLNILDMFSTHGKLTSGITGGFDRSRESTRSFTITDTFLKLIQLSGVPDKNSYCPAGDAPYKAPNYAYPIAGSVGIAEGLHQFVTMALFDNLSKNDSGGPATLVDQLLFTTKLSLVATPTITLTPVGNGTHFLGGMLGLTGSRNDADTLTVSFALPPPPTASNPPAAPGPLAAKVGAPAENQHAPVAHAAPLPQQVPGTGVRSGLFVNATGTPAELLAAQTLDQTILRNAVERAGALLVPVP
jgi:hypothetical protein